MKSFKKIITLLLALALFAVPMMALTSCGGDDAPCTDHVDADGSGVCDYCDAVVEKEEDEGTTYTVTVKNASGAPLAGAKIELLLDDVAPIASAVTDASGKVSFTSKTTGNIYAKVVEAPEGYSLPAGNVKLVSNAATIYLAAAVEDPLYTVYVKDAAGNAISGVAVQICSVSGACQLPKPTDAEGKIESRLPEDGYKALIVSVPEGYVKPEPDEYFYFEAGEYSLTITLEFE